MRRVVQHSTVIPPFLRSRRHFWKQTGLIEREPTDLGSLIDLSWARGEFVRALGCTKAWAQLVQTIRELPHEASGPSDSPTTSERELTFRWLETHHIDCLWMREWAIRAVMLIADVYHREPEQQLSIDDVLIGFGVLPVPDVQDLLPHVTSTNTGQDITVLDVILKWQAHEYPPSPINETREAFLARMVDAWNERCNAIGGSRPALKKNLAEHARWFVLHHICGQTVAKILESVESPPDDSTVSKSFKTFASLIELPYPQKHA